VIEYDETSGKPSTVLELIRAVRTLRPETAVFLRPTMKAAVAFLLAGIPRRVGTAYRYYSLLFNTRVKQHRKFAERHELEYNLDCLRAVMEVKDRTYTPKIEVDASADSLAGKVMDERGLKAKDFVIIHPGSGGSARNLPLRSYAWLADFIESTYKTRVLVTAGQGELDLVAEMDTHRSGRSLMLTGIPRLLDLAAVIGKAKLFISGSTGPMHLAAAVGTPTVCFFCPVRSCSPRRWGPVGDQNTIIMPPVPECLTCRGSACEHFDCMALIGQDRILAALTPLLAS
jgi:ADP-heptose:LPS heptosyltransferase